MGGYTIRPLPLAVKSRLPRRLRADLAGAGGGPICVLMTRLIALALAAVFLAAEAPAQTVCRPNELGAERCSGPAVRPLPRPDRIRSDVQAFDRVLKRPDAGQPATEFVPSARRNRLGSTIVDDAPGIGVCRADSLGNLRCR
jgi:hypothetical protein